jgi:ABC-type Fe3+ transport system substrate-binding protein
MSSESTMGPRVRWLGPLAATLLFLAACQQPAAPAPAAPQPPGAQAAVAAPRASPASAPAAASPELQRLIEGARQEGQLNIVWSSTYDATAFVDGFNRAYGLNLNVRYTPVPNFRAAAFQVIQEVQGGRTPSSDVVLMSSILLSRMVEADAVEAIDWSWAPNIQNPALLAPQGVGVIVAELAYGISYNTNLLTGDLVPRTMQDLLKPELKGRVASTPQAIGFGELGSPDMWGEQRLFDYVTRLSPQLAGLMLCSEEARIASGEFAAFALDCSPGSTLIAKSKGQPLEYVIPADGAMRSPAYLIVPRGAAHPNAARLWVNYMLTREAQDRFYDLNYTDTYLVPGSKSARYYEALEAAGAKITTISLQWVREQGDATQRQDRVAEILRAARSR